VSPRTARNDPTSLPEASQAPPARKTLKSEWRGEHTPPRGCKAGTVVDLPATPEPRQIRFLTLLGPATAGLRRARASGYAAPS
jgi:hypothetical protein